MRSSGLRAILISALKTRTVKHLGNVVGTKCLSRVGLNTLENQYEGTFKPVSEL